MENDTITGSVQEKRLYNLIWKRTIACQMADAQLEKTTITIDMLDAEGKVSPLNFVAQGEVVIFDGFLQVYRESSDADNDQDSDEGTLLPALNEGDVLKQE
jgi:DNA topoisomerase-1